MTTPTTAAERGKANRRKGHDAERDLAIYLRPWWPEAARKSDNGWRRGEVMSADHGDIKGTPGICWQVKHVENLNVMLAMADTADQATASAADFGILVERRDGKADPGRWWAWLTLADVGRLIAVDHVAMHLVGESVYVAPVRLEVRHVVTLLGHLGYWTGVAT